MKLRNLVYGIPLAFYSVESQAITVTEFHHGLNCQYGSFNQQGGAGAFQQEVSYAANGIENNAFEPDQTLAANLQVTCSIHSAFTFNLNSSALVRVYYRDRNSWNQNPNQSNGDLDCLMTTVDSASNQFFGPTRFSCATAGGCTTEDPGFTSPGGVATFLDVPRIDGQWRNISVFCDIPRRELVSDLRSGVLGIEFTFDPFI